jgi:hypothetical protein
MRLLAPLKARENNKMNKQTTETKEKNTPSKIQLPMVLEKTENTMPKSETDELRIDIVSGCIADKFVRFEGKYLHVDHRKSRLNQGDAIRVARGIIRDMFPDEHKDPELVTKIITKVLGDDPDEASNTIALWDGTIRCAPGNSNRVLRGPIMASINSWVDPAYRQRRGMVGDLSMLERFLDWTIVNDGDRELLLNWLAWNLQNEEKKPGWAILLYSHEKGTGKSTLCKLMAKLFGSENTFSSNGVSKITGQFNGPALENKLLNLEEIKLKPTSDQGNAIKTLITEEDTTSERKGIDVEKVKQCCVVVGTSNHLPQWLEGNDRRFLVVDMGHEGHASGPKAKDFAKFMVEFHAWMDDEGNLAKVYRALMQRDLPEDFNPKSLDTSTIDTLVMQQIRATSQETMLQQLEELLEEDGRGAIPQKILGLLVSEELRMNPNRLSHMMPDLSWQLQKAKWGGKDYARAIWVKPGYSLYRGKVTGPDGYDHPIDKQPGYSGFDLLKVA